MHVNSGPLAGARGILIRKKQNCRIAISLDAIMRSVALEIDESDVQSIPFQSKIGAVGGSRKAICSAGKWDPIQDIRTDLQLVKSLPAQGQLIRRIRPNWNDSK